MFEGAEHKKKPNLLENFSILKRHVSGCRIRCQVNARWSRRLATRRAASRKMRDSVETKLC